MTVSHRTEIKGLLEWRQSTSITPPVPEPHQSVTEGDYDILANLHATLSAALQFLSEKQKRAEPQQSGRLQTNLSGDGSEATALRSNFLGNAASSKNIHISASQTLVHGSKTTHDKVIMGPQGNEKNKNNAEVLDTATCISSTGLSFISYFWFVFNINALSFCKKKKLSGIGF